MGESNPHPARPKALPGPHAGFPHGCYRFVSPLRLTPATKCLVYIHTAQLGQDSARWCSLNRAGADFTDDDVAVATHLQPMLRLLDLAYVPDPPARAGIAQDYALTSRELEVLQLL